MYTVSNLQPNPYDHNADYPYGKPRWTKLPPNRSLAPLNGNAIIAFCLALFGFSIPAVIFGHVALYQLSWLAPLERGKPLAWVGLILGYLETIAFIIFGIWLVVHVVALIAAFSSGAWLPVLLGGGTSAGDDSGGLDELLKELDRAAQTTQ